jgi:NADH dehydrogenase subunit 5 C-terminus.
VWITILSGFYSKDLIVEVISMNLLNLIIYLFFYISVGLTVCYRFRLSYYRLTGRFNYLRLHCLIEKQSYMLKGILGLIFRVIFSGRILI